MARKLRMEYTGAGYHLMNRGDHRRAPCIRATLAEASWIAAIARIDNGLRCLLTTGKVQLTGKPNGSAGL